VTTLTIVIVSYNASRHLESCLESLTASPPSTPHQIIIVDNASPDDSVAMVRRRWPAVTVIVQPANAGFAAANNAGFRASDSELVLLLNNDTIVPAGAIDALVVRLFARPDVAVAGPRLVDGDGRPELSFGRMISPFNELRQKLTLALYRRGVGFVSRWIERETPRTCGRLGQRRVPARPPRGR
jgi:GT2 family glycosyltransferase